MDFDGNAVNVEVEATNASKAIEIALSLVDNADYANIHFVDGVAQRW